MRAFYSRIRTINDNSGFTLIELMVVVAIISILSMIVITRMSNVSSNKRENFVILTGLIAKSYDDSFLNNRTNHLLLCLHNEDPESEITNELFRRRNGAGVVNYDPEKNDFHDSKRKILQFREFPSSFSVEEVLLPSGRVITQGFEMITFYPQGYCDNNRIIHILANEDEQWSIKINRYMKEPEIIEGYATFEGEE